MDKQKICSYLNRFAPSALVILCGLVLIFSPDSVAALISQILGWGLFVVGILWGVLLLSTHARLSQFVGVAVCLMLGLWLINSPLALAKSVGRLVGLLVIVRSIQDLIHSEKPQGKVLSILMLILGVALLLLPMTASRLSFILLGAVVVILGLGMLLEQLRSKNRLDSGDDPNIIDAL